MEPTVNRGQIDQLNVKIRNLEKENSALLHKNNNLVFQVESLKKDLARLANESGSNGATIFLTLLILASIATLFILIKREAQIETRVQEAQHKKTRAAIREFFTQLTNGGSSFLQSAISSLKEPIGQLEDSDNKYTNKLQSKLRSNNKGDEEATQRGMKPKAG